MRGFCANADGSVSERELHDLAQGPMLGDSVYEVGRAMLMRVVAVNHAERTAVLSEGHGGAIVARLPWTVLRWIASAAR